MKKVKALVITGYGINCEKEMAHSFVKAGAEATIVHAKHLIDGGLSLDDYHLLAFPGGFSFGDDLGAGKALANRLSGANSAAGETLQERLLHFVDEGKCIIGVCNGFQLLVKLGLVPALEEGTRHQMASLAHNDSFRFEARWVHHHVRPSSCIFTKGLESLYLPVRHGEGKFVCRDEKIAKQLLASGQVVLQYSDEKGEPTMTYPDNPNGSWESIAGVCDTTGRIFGLMPHPEAALYFTNHPRWHRLRREYARNDKDIPKYGPGFPLFKNAVDYIKENV